MDKIGFLMITVECRKSHLFLGKIETNSFVCDDVSSVERVRFLGSLCKNSVPPSEGLSKAI